MKNLFITLILFLLSTKATAQTSPDSVVINFYEWYFSVIESGQIEEYQPEFVADSAGMTTLKMDKYIENLRLHNFTDSLINREIASYQNCIKEINKTRFDELNDKLPNLDDYRNIGCDFFNIYRWIMDVEPMNGVDVIEKINIDSNRIVIKGRFFRGNEQTKDKSYWNKFLFVALINENNIWKINQIEIRNTKDR